MTYYCPGGVHDGIHHYFGDGCLNIDDVAAQVVQLAEVNGIDPMQLWIEVLEAMQLPGSPATDDGAGRAG